MSNEWRRVVVAVVTVIGLPLVSAEKCDMGTPKSTKERQLKLVEVKRQPCGRNNKCEPGEVTCWQLQLKIQGTDKREYQCVSKGTWDSYNVGQSYP